MHAIVVHAVVVFVPLTGLAAIALTAVPRWRTRFGVLAALGALTSMGSAYVAPESGAILKDRVLSSPDTPFDLVQKHTQLGEDLLLWVLLLSIAVLALIGLAYWGKRRGADRPSWLNLAGWGSGAKRARTLLGTAGPARRATRNAGRGLAARSAPGLCSEPPAPYGRRPATLRGGLTSTGG